MRHLVLFWLVAFGVFLGVEAISVGLTSIWFAIGSLAALLCALLKFPVWLQTVWFLAVSVLMLVLTRPLAKKYVNVHQQPTNADRSIGRCGMVSESIDNLRSSGQVTLDGRIWSARSLTGEPIEKGNIVIAREIRGVKLIVEPVRESSSSTDQ